MRRLKVTGGEMVEGSMRVGTRRDGSKMRVVVEPQSLSALFRRDYELCGVKTITIEETNEELSERF